MNARCGDCSYVFTMNPKQIQEFMDTHATEICPKCGSDHVEILPDTPQEDEDYDPDGSIITPDDWYDDQDYYYPV